MMIALTAAFIAAFPVDRYLIDKGKGHALTHQFDQGHDDHSGHEDQSDQHTGHGSDVTGVCDSQTYGRLEHGAAGSNPSTHSRNCR